MNNRLTLGLVALALGLSTAGIANPFRNHAVDRLVIEANQLEAAAFRSPRLPTPAKYATQRFAVEVRQLDRCTNFGPGGQFGVPPRCQRELHQARQAFQQVAFHLRGTENLYPLVFRQFVQARQALNAVSGVGPGPQPGPAVQCVAVDNGWEEHGGGHVGYGRTLAQAQRTALMECERHHGRCRILNCR